jgi:hypothetical protein
LADSSNQLAQSNIQHWPSAIENWYLVKRMKTKTNKVSVAIAVLLGSLAGAVSLSLLLGNDTRKFEALQKNALCALELPQQTTSRSATFTTAERLEMFHVGVRTRSSDEAVSISIAGEKGTLASASGIQSHIFGLGRNIPPGTYTVTVHQERSGQGATVVIAAQEPEYLTGWQVLSRTYVGLLTVSAVLIVICRRANNPKIYAASIAAFHALLLGLVAVFLYLLFHEGGHALAQLAFGHFDLARSDFWGIRGHPHSGGTMGPPLAPWQQMVIGAAGPWLPTFVGFALFLLWTSAVGRRLRSSRPMMNLYFFAVVATLVLAEAICEPAYMLGLINAEGDPIGYVSRTGGPVWLARALLGSIFLISAFILWQVLPEIRNAWTTRFPSQRNRTALPTSASCPISH